MKHLRIIPRLLSLVLLFALAGCGQGSAPASSASSAAAETRTEEEYLAEENQILSANDGLWEKVFASMDKNVTEDVLTSNYGDFLLSAVEKAKDQFTAEEYKTLTSDAEKIREIEKKIAALSPEDAGDADSAVDSSAFPDFKGTDLDGNPQGIETAKQLLAATGASYRNIYFDSGSEAGSFALGIMAFPTTYVFDRSGKVVGEPLLGGIDKEENLAALQKNIDAALAKDAAN